MNAQRRGRDGASESPVTYGAIGGTQALDLMQYPQRVAQYGTWM